MFNKFLSSGLMIVFFSLISLSLNAQLSGKKTVGTAGDYSTLKSAFDDINSVGLNGTIKLEIISDINMPAASQAILNAWTVHGGVNDSVIIVAKGGPWTISGSVDYDAIIKLMSTTNVIIDGDGAGGKNKNLHFENSIDNGNSVFSLNGTNITCIKNCLISTGGNSSGTYGIKTSTMGNDFLTVDNCAFRSATYGMYVDGKPVGQSGNLKVKNCVFGDDNDLLAISMLGIYCNHYSNVEISGNEIKNLKSDLGAVYGIKAENSSNVQILMNNIHDVFYSGTFGLSGAGVYLSNQYGDAGFVVQNNIMRHIGGRGWNSGSAPCGIFITTGATSITKNVDIQFNTVDLTADANWGVYSTNRPLLNVTSVWLQGSIAGINMNNNIFSTVLGARVGNTSPTYGYAVYCMTSGVNPFKSISNNIYNVSNHNNNFVGYSNGTSMNLASWTNFTNDLDSKEADPLFVSDTDVNLQSCSPALLNGLSIGGVSNDIFNNSRYIHPSIGAVDNLQQAKDFNFTNITDTSFTIHWTNGNICHRIVMMQQGTTGAPILNEGVSYTANSKFMLGSNVGSWYCVYNGDGSSVNVNGLTAVTDYRLVIYEYNNVAGKEEYFMLPASNNPVNQASDFPLKVSTIKQSSFEVYPNPTADFFVVSGLFSKIEILNVNGQVVKSAIDCNNSIIDTINLSKGIYIVKAQNQSEVLMQKIVVE